jgi:hypothetical protein
MQGTYKDGMVLGSGSGPFWVSIQMYQQKAEGEAKALT